MRGSDAIGEGASSGRGDDERSVGSWRASFFRLLGEAGEGTVAGVEAGRVLGDFRLVSLLGQGGMGQVWKAEQQSLGRHVALKLVRADCVSERTLDLFAREARAGGRLHHPGLVGVHGHGESDGVAWIAMELVDDPWTLRQLLDEVARAEELPVTYHRDVASFAAALANALQAAHEAEVIHRDLKPQNVLVTPDNLPKVTDFGLARITDEPALSQTGDFAGTYYYMSPEQVAARRAGIDHRTDVFSLGVVLYEMLALRRPFEGDTAHQVAHQVLVKDPPELRHVRSRIPRELSVICGKALEKDRDRRYASMAELEADLRRFLANEPIRARPPGRLRKLQLWALRNPAKSGVAAVAALSFALISALLVENVRARHDAEQAALREGRRADEVLQLSALQDVQELVGDAERLWPPLPERRGDLEAWIGRARDLVARLPDHLATREQLLTLESAPRVEAGAASDRSSAPARWWIAQLTRLIEDLEGLADEEQGLLASDGLSAEHGWSVPRRLAFAAGLERALAPGGDHAARWASAAPEMRASCGGFPIEPIPGLVPIGPDPDSGLWELWHVASGTEPVRDADGRLVLEEGSGIVLVLMPGGTFAMGAQGEDPALPNFDAQVQRNEFPVHDVTLTPFLLSKYEMTQGQWERLSGWNRSFLGLRAQWKPVWRREGGRPDLLHPVEQVSWFDCEQVLARFDLVLPTEAQWEYGARGGTATPWWTGAYAEDLRGAANLADRYARDHDGESWPGIELWLDDGFTVHAPVGSFRANAFGLHDVVGNVWEWCRDGFDPLFYGASPPEDALAPPEHAAERVGRGSSFANLAVLGRSAARNNRPPSHAAHALGVRPARALTP